MPEVPSNAELLAQMTMFFSQFTGEEIDMGIKEAIESMGFIRTHVITPAIHMTGDLLSIPIITLERDMYLESISLNVISAFSRSTPLFTYRISTYTEDLLILPTQFMMQKGLKMTYYVERVFPLGTAFFAECESTRAYGDISVKLNFR